ncbi:hypothetical protein KUCAC02_026293 [Chaenocephalus aceratus]|uniref:Uncharacterized protein n=1 Tax=Chaenocephalus aceratus TaxID=36190 RepID=A0ACB9VX23_CHAAC|nr:hypothetical protein KUCAC02_026293 [Chaenocephalus aceratus]
MGGSQANRYETSREAGSEEERETPKDRLQRERKDRQEESGYALGNDVETKDGGAEGAGPSVSAETPVSVSERQDLAGGDDAVPRWGNRGDGAHICFCSASSSVLRETGL